MAPRKPCSSKCGLWTCSIGSNRELVRNVDSWVPLTWETKAKRKIKFLYYLELTDKSLKWAE